MNENEDMSKNINKLLTLLKQMLAQEGGATGIKGSIPPEFQNFLKDNKNFQVNLCVLAFLPIAADYLDEIENVYEETMSLDADSSGQEKSSLSMEITDQDLEFLKKNGISF